jgi:hypothetical protein
MIDPDHLCPGRLVPSLALDAALPLYPLLHFPPDDNSFRMHGFLKEAVKDLWKGVETYAQNVLDPADQKTWLAWITRAFQGLRPPTPDLSDWLATL